MHQGLTRPSGCASDRNPRRPTILEIRLTLHAPHPCRDTTLFPSRSRLGIHARLHTNYGQVCITTYYTPECTFHCLRCVGDLTAKTLFKCTRYRPVKLRHRYRPYSFVFSISPCVRSLARPHSRIFLLLVRGDDFSPVCACPPLCILLPREAYLHLRHSLLLGSVIFACPAFPCHKIEYVGTRVYVRNSPGFLLLTYPSFLTP